MVAAVLLGTVIWLKVISIGVNISYSQYIFVMNLLLTLSSDVVALAISIYLGQTIRVSGALVEDLELVIKGLDTQATV